MLIAKRSPGRAAGNGWAFHWDVSDIPIEVPVEVGQELLRQNCGYGGYYEVHGVPASLGGLVRRDADPLDLSDALTVVGLGTHY